MGIVFAQGWGEAGDREEEKKVGRRRGEQERENVQKIIKLQTCYLELYSCIDALSLERNKEKKNIHANSKFKTNGNSLVSNIKPV